jgi:hypothetical protein
MNDLRGVLMGVLSITQPRVAGRRVERELARFEDEVMLRMLGPG